MVSKAALDLVDVDMLSMVLPNCIGFWRIFEIISKEDEKAFRAVANEFVARFIGLPISMLYYATQPYVFS